MSVVAAVTVLAVTGTLMLGDAGAATSNRVEWNGRARFVAGANVPWYNWACDFGCGTSGGVFGLERARGLAATHRDQALSALEPLGSAADTLRELGAFVVDRVS